LSHLLGENKPTIAVVAAALFDARGQILIAQRPPGKSFAGHWEFPGGKRLPGESAEHALRRELQEELGVTPVQSRPVLSLTHDYAATRVRLELWIVPRFRGEPRGLEGQAIRWLSPAALLTVQMLEADWPFVELLQSSELRN
jgi:8-oxo-dGTP diphosphatase